MSEDVVTEASRSRVLLPGDFAPFTSDYLSGGYRQDELVLKQVQVEPGRIVGSLDVCEHFLPPDGGFHLTAPLAFIGVASVAIIYAHLENGLPRKESEIFLRQINLVFRRPVQKTEQIELELRLTHRRRSQSGVFYRGQISIEGGAFTGYGSFVLPLPPEKTREISEV